jgi:hypothetical protein
MRNTRNNNNSRRKLLQTAGLVHPRPDAVTAPLFGCGDPFFFALEWLLRRSRARRPARWPRSGLSPAVLVRQVDHDRGYRRPRR